jgi:hypothetical protein
VQFLTDLAVQVVAAAKVPFVEIEIHGVVYQLSPRMICGAGAEDVGNRAGDLFLNSKYVFSFPVVAPRL